jgi:hypothetical protein
MIKKLLLINLNFLLFVFSLTAQEKKEPEKVGIIPYTNVLYGGCVSNPFSFTIGVQQPLKTHISIAYDVHYWNTDYECYCDDTYTKGHFTSFTPSVKFIYNTSKRTSAGFFAGAGLGYMFAKDRGTEQSYTLDPATDEMITGKEIKTGNWDFNGISPSVTLGIGFRVLRFPVAINNTYYFAKDTKGWGAIAGGVGIKIGFRRLAADQ